MVLAPVVAAGVEVVELGGLEGLVPAQSEHVAVLGEVVVVGVETGQGGGPSGPGLI